ncbi:zinc-binding protein [Photobacterium jeanii]|uniref:Zinc-binding protein n=1 Tax=Photobacterium jeanii TaxID=858640 RepID=A0A178KNV7_9GAMM|nr:DUF2796 domain-containing protein [Photobacterium jeanii]OAN18977.1 zinc-binding protein [Photobacterium jeanii]PST87639.1 DUF2796 domain-containing protein [Photobacterium jeanii]
MKFTRTLCATILGAAISGQAFAHNHHDHGEEFRQHDAHVHGVVELNIAQDDNALLIEITAPGADVVGFEHAPKTDEQKQAFEKALTKLAQPTSFIKLATAAQCKLTESDVTETLTASHEGHDHHDHDSHDHHDHDKHDHDNHEHHDHDKHDHDNHEHHDHDKHDHDDHEHHEHDSHEHDHSGHGEFSAQYTFSCDNIDALTELQLDWFKHFTATEKVTIQAITNKGQRAGDLTPSQTQFKF